MQLCSVYVRKEKVGECVILPCGCSSFWRGVPPCCRCDTSEDDHAQSIGWAETDPWNSRKYERIKTSFENPGCNIRLHQHETKKTTYIFYNEFCISWTLIDIKVTLSFSDTAQVSLTDFIFWSIDGENDKEKVMKCFPPWKIKLWPWGRDISWTSAHTSKTKPYRKKQEFTSLINIVFPSILSCKSCSCQGLAN